MIILEEKHKASFLIGLAFLLIGFVVKVFYLRHIDSIGLKDFGLAGSLPSFLGVIGFSQLLQIRPIKYPSLVMIVVTAGSIIYEYKKSFQSGTLEVNNIVASIVGGAVSLLILYIVTEHFKNKDKQG